MSYLQKNSSTIMIQSIRKTIKFPMNENPIYYEMDKSISNIKKIIAKLLIKLSWDNLIEISNK